MPEHTHVDHTVSAQQRGAAVGDRPARPAHPLLTLQRQLGNAHVSRLVIQRDPPTQAPAPQGAPTGQTTEAVVPVPDEQQQAVAGDPQAAGGQQASQPSGGGGAASGQPAATPPVPRQARIVAPVEFNFQALPPELRLRFFEELRFTATVSNARLLWQHQRLQLGLGYNYGGAISADGADGPFSASAGYDPSNSQLTTGARYRIPGAGTLSGGAGYNFQSGMGSASAGYSQAGWQARASASTAGSFGASLGYGAVPPTATQLGDQVVAGEAAGRSLIGALPGVAGDPATLPATISAHGEDIAAVQQVAKSLGEVADMRANSRGVHWGLFLNFNYNPQSGATGTFNAALQFARDEAAATKDDD